MTGDGGPFLLIAAPDIEMPRGRPERVRDSAFTSEAEIGSRKHIIAPAAFVGPSQADALSNLWAKTTLKSPPSTEICVLPNCYTFKESLFEAKKRLLAP